MHSLSLDLRERIVAALDDPMDTYASIAARFSVSQATVERLSRKKREGTDLKPLVSPGRTPIVTPSEYADFERLVASRSDWTTESLAQAWTQQSGKAISDTTVGRLLHRFGFTHKKSPASPANETTQRGKPSAKA
jgi:transposase